MPLPPSLGFGFPTATPHGVTSRHAADSQAHSSKGTPSPTQQGALTDCRHMVSGTISLSSRGTFHHSLTVLIHYRSHSFFKSHAITHTTRGSHGLYIHSFRNNFTPLPGYFSPCPHDTHTLSVTLSI